MCKDMSPLELAIQFHGHICPGLLMGVRASTYALDYLQASRDVDEELVAVVETNSCGVDAIQAILGCTFGKGSLIYKDYGKAVYTIASRHNGKAVRIAQKFGNTDNPLFHRFNELKQQPVLSDAEQAESEQLLGDLFEYLMSADFNTLFHAVPVDFDFPPRATSEPTVQCSVCQEGVMQSRAVTVNQEICCPACAAHSPVLIG